MYLEKEIFQTKSNDNPSGKLNLTKKVYTVKAKHFSAFFKPISFAKRIGLLACVFMKDFKDLTEDVDVLISYEVIRGLKASD